MSKKSLHCGMENGEKWEDLIKMIRRGNCTPFLGAGACSHILPLGAEVSRILAQKYKYPLSDEDNLQRVSQFIAIKKDEPTSLKYEVVDILKDKGKPDFSDENEPHKILARLPFPIYITTNYDDFMFKALEEENGREPQFEFCRWNNYITKNFPFKIKKEFIPSYEKPLVYHLHGNWNIPESLVITEDDYIEFLVTVTHDFEGKLPHRVLRSLSGEWLIFIGYNLQDISFRSIFQGLLKIKGNGLRRTNISVQLTPCEMHKKFVDREIKDLNIILPDLKFGSVLQERIKKSVQVLMEIAEQDNITSSQKNKLYDEVSDLETHIIKSRIDKVIKESLLYRVNNLQNEINQISDEDDEKNQQAINYLKKYYKEWDICIYWGDTLQFTKDLIDRWNKFQMKSQN